MIFHPPSSQSSSQHARPPRLKHLTNRNSFKQKADPRATAAPRPLLPAIDARPNRLPVPGPFPLRWRASGADVTITHRGPPPAYRISSSFFFFLWRYALARSVVWSFFIVAHVLRAWRKWPDATRRSIFFLLSSSRYTPAPFFRHKQVPCKVRGIPTFRMVSPHQSSNPVCPPRNLKTPCSASGIYPVRRLFFAVGRENGKFPGDEAPLPASPLFLNSLLCNNIRVSFCLSSFSRSAEL